MKDFSKMDANTFQQCLTLFYKLEIIMAINFQIQKYKIKTIKAIF